MGLKDIRDLAQDTLDNNLCILLKCYTHVFYCMQMTLSYWPNCKKNTEFYLFDGGILKNKNEYVTIQFIKLRYCVLKR